MKNIGDLRESLFDTIERIKEKKIDIYEAKAIAEIGQVIVNSAKAEVEFIKHKGGGGTGFIDSEQQTIKPKLGIAGKR